MSQHYLIIDDDPVFCRVLERAFLRRNLSVSSANDPDGALHLAHQQAPSHVVLDLKLGTHSGLDLIQPLLDIQPETKILLLTGYASIPTAVEAVRRGAINYLSKPADADDILAAFKPDASTPEIPEDPPSLKRLEWEHIQRVLNEHEGNISAAARALGMHRRTLQRKLQKKPVKQ